MNHVPVQSQVQHRGREGRFAGVRANVETVPAIPSRAAAVMFKDPERRPLVLVWESASDRRLAVYAVALEPVPNLPDWVRIVPVGSMPVTVRTVHVPRATRAHMLGWCCPSCFRPVLHLYPFGRVNGELTLAVGCRWCLRLRFSSQGGAKTPRRILRSLTQVEVDKPVPRALCLPTAMIRADETRRLRRYRNLAVGGESVQARQGVME